MTGEAEKTVPCPKCDGEGFAILDMGQVAPCTLCLGEEEVPESKAKDYMDALSSCLDEEDELGSKAKDYMKGLSSEQE